MNRLFVFFVIIFFTVFLGCTGVDNYLTNNYQTGIVKHANIGDSLISWEYGQKQRLNNLICAAIREEIILKDISDSIITIKYQRYGKRRDFGPADWRFEEIQFDVSKDKFLNYKDIQIEVVKLGSKTISYKIIHGPK